MLSFWDFLMDFAFQFVSMTTVLFIEILLYKLTLRYFFFFFHLSSGTVIVLLYWSVLFLIKNNYVSRWYKDYIFEWPNPHNLLMMTFHSLLTRKCFHFDIIYMTSCKRSVERRVRMLLNALRRSHVKICHNNCFLTIKLVERK